MNYVELRNNRRGEPRAYISGTRVRVQDIATDVEYHGQSVDQIAAQIDLTLAQVHGALAYYFDNRELVRSHMKADAEFISRMANGALSADTSQNGG